MHRAGQTWLRSVSRSHGSQRESPSESFTIAADVMCSSVLITCEVRPAFGSCPKHRGAVCSEQLFNLNSCLLVFCPETRWFSAWCSVSLVKGVMYHRVAILNFMNSRRALLLCTSPTPATSSSLLYKCLSSWETLLSLPQWHCYAVKCQRRRPRELQI